MMSALATNHDADLGKVVGDFIKNSPQLIGAIALMGGAGGAMQTQQQLKNGGEQTQADESQKTDDTGSSSAADQSSSTTTAGRPSTPPLSVEQSQKLIHNVMNRPPEQRGHPTTQADLAQAQWVVREHLRKLESQTTPLSDAQKKALADAKAALARVVPEVKPPQPNGLNDQGDKKTTGPQLPFPPSPNLEWHVPHEPTRHLLPDKPFDATRKPTKPEKVLDKSDTEEGNIRGVNGENETALVLAQNGYDYEQVAQNKKKLPDGTFAGRPDGVFGKAKDSKSDVYSPAAKTSMRNIYDVVVGKVDRQKSPYVVVRIEPGGQSIEEITKKFHDHPIEGLKQLFIVKEGKLYIIY